MASVLRLFISPAHGLPMREVPESRAIVDWGLEGCAHARGTSKRQVLLMDSETLQEFSLRPGQVKENLLTLGLDLHALTRGQRLRIGEALLEVTIPCEPCNYIESLRPGLEKALRGRRGMLTRVVEGGLIRPGDAIELA